MTPELYVSIYYFILLIIVLCYSFFSRGNDINSQGILSFALLIFVFGIITFRDIDPIFGDTISYARHYVEYTIWGIKGIDPSKFKDVGFEWLTLFLSKFDNLTVYFGSIAIVYLLPVYLAGIITPGCFVIGYFFRDAIKPQIDKLRDIIFKEK